MLKLSDIDVTKKAGHTPQTMMYEARVTMGASFTSAPSDLGDIDDFEENIKADLKKAIVQGIYGEVSDDIVRIGQRVMHEVKDPAVSADIYADLEILYEKLNQYESE